MLKKTIVSIACIAIANFSFAQKTDYRTVKIIVPLPPTITQYGDYKTYDVITLTTKEVPDKPGTGFNLDFQVKAGNLKQVNDSGDFHIVTVLQRYNGKMTTTSTCAVNIYLTTTVYDKYGAIVKENVFNSEAYTVKLDKEPTKAEAANADFMRKAIVEKLLEASLQSFNDAMFGAQPALDIRIASLDDVKKKPELQEFDVQEPVLKAALYANKLPGFKTAAQPYISYWEKMKTYNANEDSNEVRRAALHNLALYYIADVNFEKATSYIELYKPIDKQIKEMFGLIKYKNSEELEKLIPLLNPTATSITANNNSAIILSKAQMAEQHQFLTINGTAKVSGKKIDGEYNGVIKVNKIPAKSFGNVVSLDPANIDVSITYKDGAETKIINTTISHIDELKDDKGSIYTSQKFGNGLGVLGGSYYIFMKSTYTSPKVIVYRDVFSNSGQYLVKKTGDDKGVKSSIINARKNLEDYFSDCESLKEKFKTDVIDKKASVEKIAEEYTNCK